MNSDFNKTFDSFLNERMGEAVAGLKQVNEKYRSALTEYSNLVQQVKNNEITDYKQAFNRLAELGEHIRDIECRFYFYTGLAMHKRMDDAASSFALPDSLTE